MENIQKDILNVFLCHASGDKPAIRLLYKHLRSEGIDVWLDEEKLLPGEEWEMEITEAVRRSDAVIVCLSNKSITKEGFVQKEISFALDIAHEKPEGTIFIIPAKLEECDVPSRLSRWQWVNLFYDGKNFDRKSLEKLMNALYKRAAFLGKQPNSSKNLPTKLSENEISNNGKIKHTNKLKAKNSKELWLRMILGIIAIVTLISWFSFGYPRIVDDIIYTLVFFPVPGTREEFFSTVLGGLISLFLFFLVNLDSWREYIQTRRMGFLSTGIILLLIFVFTLWQIITETIINLYGDSFVLATVISLLCLGSGTRILYFLYYELKQ